MEVLIGFIIARIQLLIFLLMTRRAAFGINIKFWLFFVLGLFIPFISVVLLMRRPVRKKNVQQVLLTPVSSEEIFDHALHLKEPRRDHESEIQFLARA